MYYIVETQKTFEQAAADLDSAVKQNNFGILHIHDIGNTLRGKGIEFTSECRVFEVCNPMQAKKVLDIDIRLNMALPCRISVYSEQGTIRIGMITPNNILSDLSDDPALRTIANEVEMTMKKIIDEAR